MSRSKRILLVSGIIFILAVAVMLLLPVHVDGVSQFAVDARVTDAAGRPLEGVAVSFRDVTPASRRNAARPLGRTGADGRLAIDVRHRWGYDLAEWRFLAGRLPEQRYELRFEHPRGSRAIVLEQKALRRAGNAYVIEVRIVL